MAIRTEQKYCELVDRVKNRFEPRILEILGKYADACRAEGFLVDMGDRYDDEYCWYLRIDLFPNLHTDAERWHIDSNNAADYLDCDFYLIESLVRDGTLDGLSFALSSNLGDGRVAGPSLCPNNYTDKLWISPYNNELLTRTLNYFDDANEFALLVREVRDEEEGHANL